MLTIWTNASLPEQEIAQLRQGVGKHRLIFASNLNSLNLSIGEVDPSLAEADIAFGQPLPEQVWSVSKLRWVHLTTAGYTSYDRKDFRTEMNARGASVTTSSGVYDEPCAQHLLAMMMAFARQLPQSLDTQRTDRGWPAAQRRSQSFLLEGQTAVLVGFGEIAKRLCELLAPLHMKLVGVRRAPQGDEPITMLRQARIVEAIAKADHVINMLPSNDSTERLFRHELFQAMKPGSYFYNIGRGATVDQAALLQALQSHHIAGAYLDVMTPEPLPFDSPLWIEPNCYITPHSAGGFRQEMSRLVEHFLTNLRRFEANETLLNRVI